MRKQSAGILLYRRRNGFEFLLVHPGGPLWAKKDHGAWTIPKGELDGENPLEAAKREFEEETGCRLEGPFTPLTPITQASGKQVLAWATEGEFDVACFRSNMFEMEWPPKSGHKSKFPEVDKAEWFPLEEAVKRINPAQIGFIEEVVALNGER